MKIKLLAAALLLAATAIPAFADSHTDGNICLMRRQIDGWGSHGDHAMVVNDRFGRKYLLSLAGLCQDLDFAFGVGIRSFGHFQDTCVDRGDHVVMRGGGALPHNDACWITKVELYTPEMEKAYKADLEAKKHDHSY